MKLGLAILILLTVTGCYVLFVCCASSSADYEKLDKYTGSPISSRVMICKSDQYAGAGYWNNLNDNSVEAGARVAKEKKTTTWRIIISEKLANVIRYTAATENLEEPERFSVETASGGILLKSLRAPGESSDIITINFNNSSFVYTTQHVNPMWNRANIFYGTCSPAF